MATPAKPVKAVQQPFCRHCGELATAHTTTATGQLCAAPHTTSFAPADHTPRAVWGTCPRCQATVQVAVHHHTRGWRELEELYSPGTGEKHRCEAAETA
jgi:hypothetical protein